jgi:8-oxo-dGTP pyrophosphatase MutT (NUDIX family)
MNNKPRSDPVRSVPGMDLDAPAMAQRVEKSPAWRVPRKSAFAAASVMLLLYEKNRQPCMLAVLKTDTRGYPWRNQVALPGGHADPQDSSALDTALREVGEELGIRADEIQVIGSLGHFSTIRQTVIEVFLGIWDGDPASLCFDSTEIAQVIEIPVSALRQTHEMKGFAGRDPDISELTYPYADVTIWGVTARMVHFLLEHII